MNLCTSNLLCILSVTALGCASPPPEGRYPAGGSPGAQAEGGTASEQDEAASGGAGGNLPTAGGNAQDGQGQAGNAQDGDGQAGNAGTGPDGSVQPPSSGEPPFFGFPQNRHGPYCVHPSYDNADMHAAWSKWKQRAVTASGAGGNLRVRRWTDGDDTVSEGIAYGVLASVYMDDQETFDALFKYEQSYLNQNGVMHWRIGSDGSILGRNGATDADEDIAWALIMADRQWGGQGNLDDTYLHHATAQVERVWTHEVDHNGGHVLKPGDNWGGRQETNPSYFSPAYYRVFGQVSDNVSGWQRVIDSSYEILDKAAHSSTGLAPAWCDDTGQMTRGDQYQYDACRIPFRIALDYCFFGESRARDLLMKASQFFADAGAANIWDGYLLDGTPNGWSTNSMAFTGPAGVGAMVDASFQAFVDEAYVAVVELGSLDSSYRYYDSSVGLLSLLMMSGNFLNYTDPP